jgi:predicted ATPase
MKCKIRNFGPISQGFPNDGYMNINGVVIFIGGQGTGKSSIAKVLSTIFWIEKALVRGDFSEKTLKLPGRFKKNFSFHGIDEYFQKETEIDYWGEYYRLHYSSEKLTIIKNDFGPSVLLPKIMYIPSERNFLSAIPKPSTISDLSPSIATFLDEYESAKRKLSGPITLPVKKGSFSYDKLNDVSWVEKKGNKTRLSQSSSGYQSVIPLFVVTNYLSNLISNEEIPLNVNNFRNIRKELGMILSNEAIDTSQKNYFLNMILPKYRPSYFINIVEEPEQNLFPESQIRVFHSLLDYFNRQRHNQLIITTHSPYIVNALSLAVACFIVQEKSNGNEKIRTSLREIVPEAAWVSPDKFTIFQLDENGTITQLDNHDSLPSDDNLLNVCLGEFNEAFARILEVEDSL